MDINILVSLPPNANDHSQLTFLSPDVKSCDNHAQCRAYTTPNLDILRNWSASRLQLLIERSADRSLCRTSVALSYRWISTSSLSLFMNANEHNQLTSPILMLIIPYVCLWVYTRLAVKACTQTCRASISLSIVNRLPIIGTPTDRSLCYPCTINGFNRIVTFRTTFVEPVYERQRPQLIDISESRYRTL
jgi:hypothetical protein